MGATDWAAWRFLLGEWVGEGGGAPGQGSASFRFHPDLGDNILVRRSRMEFPGTETRPAFIHEDLLLVYQEGAAPAQAIYFDNEGHVIHYEAEAAADGGTVTLVSEARPSEPRFRLSYVENPDATLTTRFEMAPPGQPDLFSVYMEGTSRRQ